MTLTELLSTLPARLGEISYTIVLPILLMIGIGWLLQRRFHLDMTTLRRLNFYFVLPPLVYVSVVASDVNITDVGRIVLFALGSIAALAALTYIAARLRGVPAGRRRALMMTTVFYNSGNYGLPLQELAFSAGGHSAAALGYQTFVMLTQNFANFTLGIAIVSGGGSRRSWRETLLHIAKFPPIYALASAVLTVLVRQWLGPHSDDAARWLAPIWAVLLRVKAAFIPLALFTLGAQLAIVPRGNGRDPVKLSVLLRLLAGPAIALGLVWLLGFEGIMAQALLISSCTPTAVNVMLLCLEFDNHPDYAARAVFYSTLLSPITVTLVIFLAQGGFLPGFSG